MKTYYEVRINHQSKAVGSKGNYQGLGETRKPFSDLEAARKFLKEEYSKCKVSRMYQDPKETECGRIYSFINQDWGHNSKSWYQQDWVTIYQHKVTRIDGWWKKYLKKEVI